MLPVASGFLILYHSVSHVPLDHCSMCLCIEGACRMQPELTFVGVA